MKCYGKELILDLHDCDIRAFNRKDISKYFRRLCNRIGMVPADLHFWDYTGYPGGIRDKQEAPDHLAGTSAIQFIQTSNITLHSLDKLRVVYVNIFSCQDFDMDLAANFTAEFFGGIIVNSTNLERL